MAAVLPPSSKLPPLQALADLLVSPLTGLIKRVVVEPRCSDEPAFLYPSAVLPDYGRLPGMQRIDATGGCGVEADESLARLLFETVERYCLASAPSGMLFGRAQDESFLCGNRWPLFADWQYARSDWPFSPLIGDSEIWWTRGESLLTGRTVWAPASLVYVPYRPTCKAESLGPSISTGAAAGWNEEAAALSAILELCERDAFAIMWLNGLTMPRIRVCPTSALGCEISRTLGRSDASISFVNITNDTGIPAVIAVLEYRFMGRPFASFGAAAKLNFTDACRKAFSEAANAYVLVISQLEELQNRWHPAADGSNITDWRWHNLAYAFPEFDEARRFVTASGQEQKLGSLDAGIEGRFKTLSHVVAALQPHFPEIALVRLTTREFEELGVSVVKALIPQAAVLSPDHRFPWLGCSRLHTVPSALGYRAATGTPAELILRAPHPFS